MSVYWINNEVWVAVGEIAPKESGSLPWDGETVQSSEPDHKDQSNSHTKLVDNSGSATTVLATKYLYIDAKCLFWDYTILPCQQGLVPWDNTLVLAGHPPS